jgi:hypothetical protein
VIGSLLVLASLGLLGVGGAGMWADQVQRGADGYVTLGTQTYSSAGYAVASDRIHIYGVTAGWGAVRDLLGDVRVSAAAQDPSRSTFVGIAPSGSVDGYLNGVSYTTVRDLGPSTTVYSQHAGGALATVPTANSFWTASSSGLGTQTVRWSPSDGDWTVVVLNADASRRVAVTAQVGATLPALGWLAGGLLVLGALSLAAGITLVAAAVVRAGRPTGSPR